MSIIKRPHDKLFKEMLKDRETAKDFLESYLPQEILVVIDLDTLEQEKDSFIEPNLAETYSDVLYKTAINQETAYLYFLFEHKSYLAPRTALQLLKYIISIWEKKTKEDEELPVIIPLVVYHGEKTWQIPLNLAGIIKGIEKLPSYILDYIPDFKYLFYEFSPNNKQEIKGKTIKLQVLLQLLASIFMADKQKFLQIVMNILINIDNLTKEEKADIEMCFSLLETCMTYLMNTRQDITYEEVEQIAENISQEGRDKIMTLAEQLVQKGMEKGIEKGIEKVVLASLKKGLSIDDIVDITGLDAGKILKLKEKVFN